MTRDPKEYERKLQKEDLDVRMVNLRTAVRRYVEVVQTTYPKAAELPEYRDMVQALDYLDRWPKR